MLDLKSAKLFEGLPDGEIKKIERQLKLIQHPKGHDIVVRGDGGVGFMIITDGTVTVTTVQGKTRQLGPGDSFGEMALLDHHGRSATVKDTDVSLATIPEGGFKSFPGGAPGGCVPTAPGVEPPGPRRREQLRASSTSPRRRSESPAPSESAGVRDRARPCRAHRAVSVPPSSPAPLNFDQSSTSGPRLIGEQVVVPGRR
jgi:hypothetical protein